MNATKYGKYCTHVNTQLNVYFKHDVVGYQSDKSLKPQKLSPLKIYYGLLSSNIMLKTIILYRINKIVSQSFILFLQHRELQYSHIHCSYNCSRFTIRLKLFVNCIIIFNAKTHPCCMQF